MPCSSVMCGSSRSFKSGRRPPQKMLEASAAMLQKAGDTIGHQGSRLERERADRDEVQDRLNHLVNQVATHVLRLRDAYRRASATMSASG